MRSLLFLFREFLTSLTQNRFLHFTYGAQVTISLLVLGIFFVLLTGAVVAWNRLGSNLKIHVYLVDGLSEAETARIQTDIEQLDNVLSIEYRSKDDALAIMSEKYPEMGIEGLGSDWLPASFVVEVKQPMHIEDVAHKIAYMPGVEKLDYGSDVVKSFVRVAMILVVICIVTILLLVIFTSSSISNIIGLSIYARRTEIRIMQLVGATWWFIRWPFIFEGVFFGIVGAIIAGLIISALLAMLSEALRLTELTLMLPFININSTSIYVSLIALLLGLGAAVGFYGSLRTVNAFLGRENIAQMDAMRVRRQGK
jgi:cell division transport system permease protein